MLLNDRILRSVVFLVLVFLLGLGVGGSVGAVDIRSASAVNVGKGEVIDDDLFLAGETIVMDGTVNGDLLAFGNDITVNGTVNGSLIVAGQILTLNGQVSGSVYGAGASLTLGPNAVVGRNAYYGGYSLATQGGSLVRRDLLMGGYQAIVGGEVGRHLKAGLGALELSGQVKGDVQIAIGEPGSSARWWTSFYQVPGVRAIDPGLRVDPEARIGGKLVYTSGREQGSTITAKPAGGVVYQTPVAPEPSRPAPAPVVQIGLNMLGWLLARAREFITLLVLGALALWKLPALLQRVTEQARDHPLPAAGWGLVVVIVGYVGALVIAGVIVALAILFWVVTLGGLAGTALGVGFASLGLVFTLFSLLVSYGSKLVVAYLVGQLIASRLGPQAAESKAWALVIGAVVYVVLRGIPLFGWLVGLAATLAGLGAMWLVYRQWRVTSAPVLRRFA